MPLSVLITGSTDGLGRRVAELLVERGEAVLVHGRDREKVERTVRELGAERGYVADLGSLAEVRRLAEEVKRDRDELDVLVNNAGVADERGSSAEGLELTFAVNHLAHFVLTLELLPIVRRRIVNVASGAQAPIDFDDPMLERSWEGLRAYGQSKLAQVMFTFELAERLGPGGPAVNALHPASRMATKMVRRRFGRPRTSVDKGAQPTLRLIVDAEGVTGRYFEGTREAAAHRQAYDPEARRRLWELSERLALIEPTRRG